MAERGLIFDIKKYAIHDGPGIRTTVFFKGCPLNCRWCHNPESRRPETENIEITRTDGSGNDTRKIGRYVTVDELVQELAKDIVFYDQSGGGITFSGGEPLYQAGFLKEISSACKEKGMHTVIDTCGHVPFEDFEMVIDHTDEWYYDLKFIDKDKHKEYTGVSNDLILDNLARLSRSDAAIIIRIPLVPDITDTEDNLIAIADFLLKHKNLNCVNLLPYNKFGEDKRKRFGMAEQIDTLKTQSEKDLQIMAAIFRQRGLRVKIGG